MINVTNFGVRAIQPVYKSRVNAHSFPELRVNRDPMGCAATVTAAVEL